MCATRRSSTYRGLSETAAACRVQGAPDEVVIGGGWGGGGCAQLARLWHAQQFWVILGRPSGDAHQAGAVGSAGSRLQLRSPAWRCLREWKR
jgi:hypothetical protein